MKLSEWAKINGISYGTSYRWFKEGKLPVEAIQTKSGTILIKDAQIIYEYEETHALENMLGLINYFCMKLFGPEIGSKKYKQVEIIIRGIDG